jgi:hypothetical protein
MFRSVCLAAAAALLLAIPSSASAFWPYYGGFGSPWSYGYGSGYPLIYSDYIPSPPYYSIYPPVYYSAHITKRHYGAAPYAWPAGMQPITYVNYTAVAAADPLMVETPYVQGARPTSAKTTAEAKLEVKPQRLDNPHFVKTGR